MFGPHTAPMYGTLSWGNKKHMAGHNSSGRPSAFQVKKHWKASNKDFLFAAGSSFKQQNNPGMGHDLPLAQITIAEAVHLSCIKMKLSRGRARLCGLHRCTSCSVFKGRSACEMVIQSRCWIHMYAHIATIPLIIISYFYAGQRLIEIDFQKWPGQEAADNTISKTYVIKYQGQNQFQCNSKEKLYWPKMLFSWSFNTDLESTTVTSSQNLKCFIRFFQEKQTIYFNAFGPNSVVIWGTNICKILRLRK